MKSHKRFDEVDETMILILNCDSFLFPLFILLLLYLWTVRHHHLWTPLETTLDTHKIDSHLNWVRRALLIDIIPVARWLWRSIVGTFIYDGGLINTEKDIGISAKWSPLTTTNDDDDYGEKD